MKKNTKGVGKVIKGWAVVPEKRSSQDWWSIYWVEGRAKAVGIIKENEIIPVEIRILPPKKTKKKH